MMERVVKSLKHHLSWREAGGRKPGVEENHDIMMYHDSPDGQSNPQYLLGRTPKLVVNTVLSLVFINYYDNVDQCQLSFGFSPL
jgi:hypothetical protein